MLTFAQDYRHPRLGAAKPSLTVNRPGDSYEQEAECVADRVTRGAGLDGRVRDGLEKGTEKGCEAAIDASNAPDEVKEGMKAACKAAWKAKPK
jgi:hypothetical protein